MMMDERGDGVAPSVAFVLLSSMSGVSGIWGDRMDGSVLRKMSSLMPSSSSSSRIVNTLFSSTSSLIFLRVSLRSPEPNRVSELLHHCQPISTRDSMEDDWVCDGW